MKTPKSRPSKPTPRQIVGLSLPPEIVAEVKLEAASRGLTLRNLFIEMWSLYQKNNKA